MPPSEKAIGKPPLTPLDELKKGTNYLFAIGINTYDKKYFNPLNNARKDVEDIANVLVKDYYFEPQHIRLLCDQEATKANILDELDDFRKKIKHEDRLLIYYSGHGHLEGSQGFWIPVDAIRDKISSYIRSAEVRDIIQSIDARHILLISDSCFSASLLVRGGTRDINSTLMDWERNPSRWVFISGKGVVSDGETGTNSPFAKGILKYLNQNEEEALNIIRLADRVTQEVGFNYEQKAEISPLFQSGHEGGQFIFFKKQSERDDWQNALLINTEGMYVRYLNKYPDGQFVDAAELKLEQIADENEWKTAGLRDSAASYRAYLRKYPSGNHALEAKNKLKGIDGEEAEIEKIKADEEVKRLEKVEADRKEVARIAKIKADEETARLEQERQAKIEADKVGATLAVAQNLERERLEKIIADEEAKSLERERQVKIETDRIEAVRIAKIKADEEAARLERERLAKLKADEVEAARIAKIKADKKEQERLAKIEKDKVEAAHLSATYNNQQQTNNFETPSVFQKYRVPIIGTSAVAIGFLVWQLTAGHGKTETPPNSSQTYSTPTNTGQENNPTTTQPVTNTDKPAEQPIKSFKKTVDEIKSKAGNPREQTKKNNDDYQKTIDKANDRMIGSIKSDNNSQIQADKISAQKYLKNALRFIEAGEYSSATSALSSAYYLNSLSSNAKKYISNAMKFIEAYEYDSAKNAVNSALNEINY